KEALVRIHNTNTRKIIWSRFAIDEGQSAVDGDLAIPGVSGTGAPVRLEFREPGGATTGKLLPTGNVIDTLEVPGYGSFRASLVDAANATCFLDAADLGLKGTEMPEELDRNAELLKKLAAIRIAASLAMGIGKTPEEAAEKATVPFIGFVSAAQDAPTLAGERISGVNVDLTARMLSNGQPHRALPLTVTLCTAIAARIEGSIVNRLTRGSEDTEAELRIAMPSGVLTVAASVLRKDGQWHAEQGAFYRTQRRMFEGYVLVRASRVPGLAAASGGKLKAA
ncbi:MAG TPA: PrpF domain-containing protein, partial [Longimicrobiales bacterium]